MKKGWENIKPPTQEINGVIESIHGNDGYYGAEYTAYDSYGMSMIFVFISPDGNLIRSNGRWNHGFGNKTKHKPGCSVDYEFKKEDIIELLGSDEIFKIGCSAYQSMIDNGKDLSSIFNKIMELPYGYKLGFLSSVFSDTCCNIITPNNKMFIDTNNKNYWLRFNKRITNDLYIVSSSFATYILDFSNGDMDIYLFSLKKLLDKNISLEGICDSVCDLGNGETYIRINNFCNIVNENGDLVFGDDNLINWCFEIFIYTASELCLVRKSYTKNNYYDLETKTVLFGDIKNYNGWLEDISPISNYYHYIDVYGWSNIINIKTKTVLFGDKDDIDTWSDSVDKFRNNTYKVLKDGLVTLVLFKDDGECKILTDTDGNVIWGKSIFIEDDLIIIRKNDDEGWGRENYLRLTNDGCIGIFGDINNPETWFREVRRRGSNLFVVREVDSRDNDKFNCFVLTNDGYQLIYGNVYNVDEWFQYLRILDDFIIVTKNYKRNYLVQDNDNGGYKCVSGDINDTNT